MTESQKIDVIYNKMNDLTLVIDGWHLMKSSMIVFLIASIVLYKSLFGIFIDFVLIGFVWNLIFNFFYNVILIK